MPSEGVACSVVARAHHHAGHDDVGEQLQGVGDDAFILSLDVESVTKGSAPTSLTM